MKRAVYPRNHSHRDIFSHEKKEIGVSWETWKQRKGDCGGHFWDSGRRFSKDFYASLDSGSQEKKL